MIRLINDNDPNIDIYKSKLDNFSLNRFDIVEGEQGDSNSHLILLDDKKTKEKIIAYHINDDECWLGIYLLDINAKQLKKVIHLIWKKNPTVKKIHIKQARTKIDGLCKTNHWAVELPESVDDLESRLTSKSRYNIRRSKSLIERNIGEVKILCFTKDDCPEEFIESFFSWKKEQMGTEYNFSAQEYLSYFFVTNIYCLIANQQLLSIAFTCEQGSRVYLENLGYDCNVKELSPGTVLYDAVLKILIEKNKIALFLGDGNQFYKTRYGAIEQKNTYGGIIYKKDLLNRIRSKISKLVAIIKCKQINELIISDNKKLLVVAPHPYDEVLGCGELLLKYNKQISVLLMTNGNLGIPGLSKKKTEEKRYAEFDEAMKMLKVGECIKLGIDDSSMRFFDIIKVMRKIGFRNYDYIFIPGIKEDHPDHRMTSKIFRTLAFFTGCSSRLVQYEVWSPLSERNAYISFEKYDKKRELIDVYQSQLKYVNYV